MSGRGWAVLNFETKCSSLSSSRPKGALGYPLFGANLTELTPASSLLLFSARSSPASAVRARTSTCCRNIPPRSARYLHAPPYPWLHGPPVGPRQYVAPVEPLLSLRQWEVPAEKAAAEARERPWSPTLCQMSASRLVRKDSQRDSVEEGFRGPSASSCCSTRAANQEELP